MRGMMWRGRVSRVNERVDRPVGENKTGLGADTPKDSRDRRLRDRDSVNGDNRLPQGDSSPRPLVNLMQAFCELVQFCPYGAQPLKLESGHSSERRSPWRLRLDKFGKPQASLNLLLDRDGRFMLAEQLTG